MNNTELANKLNEYLKEIKADCKLRFSKVTANDIKTDEQTYAELYDTKGNDYLFTFENGQWTIWL